MERPRKSKPEADEVDDAPAEKSEKSEKSDRREKSETKRPVAKAPSGYNWPAVIILCMFALAPIISGGIYLYDYLNPVGKAKLDKAVAVDLFKSRLGACYKVAAPEKVKNVDKLASNIFQPHNEKFTLHQARSKERVFWAKMMELYGKHDECDN